MAFFMINHSEIAVVTLLISILLFIIALIRLFMAARLLSRARNKDHRCIECLSKAERIKGIALPVWHGADHDTIEIYVSEQEKCTFHLQPDDLHPVPGDTVVLYRLPEPLPNAYYVTDETHTYMTETSYRFAYETEQRNGCCPAGIRKRSKDSVWLFTAVAGASIMIFFCSCSAIIEDLRRLP